MKKLFGVGPNSYTIVGHPFYALVVLNSIFRNLESGILLSLIHFGNNPGLLHFPPNWRKSQSPFLSTSLNRSFGCLSPLAVKLERRPFEPCSYTLSWQRDLLYFFSTHFFPEVWHIRAPLRIRKARILRR